MGGVWPFRYRASIDMCNRTKTHHLKIPLHERVHRLHYAYRNTQQRGQGARSPLTPPPPQGTTPHLGGETPYTIGPRQGSVGLAKGSTPLKRPQGAPASRKQLDRKGLARAQGQASRGTGLQQHQQHNREQAPRREISHRWDCRGHRTTRAKRQGVRMRQA